MTFPSGLDTKPAAVVNQRHQPVGTPLDATGTSKNLVFACVVQTPDGSGQSLKGRPKQAMEQRNCCWLGIHGRSPTAYLFNGLYRMRFGLAASSPSRFTL